MKDLEKEQAEADEALHFITVAMEKASERKQEVAILKQEVEAKARPKSAPPTPPWRRSS